MRPSILLLSLLLAACAAAPSRAPDTAAPPAPRESSPRSAGPAQETGLLDGARYRVDIPADWNGELVMILRGYVTPGTPREGEMPRGALTEALLQRGYAVAASDYRSQGWSVAEALEDNERLRRHVGERFGEPARHWLMGFSMGGLLTLASIERHPDAYAGALALCGANAPAGEMFNEVLLTVLVSVEYFFPGSLGEAALDDLDGPARIDPQRIEAALAMDEATAERLAQRLQIPRPMLASISSFYYLILRELQQRAGGHPLDNRDTVYAGFGDDLAFNRGVRRTRADPAAADYLRRYASLDGRTPVPVILLSNISDAVVPLHISNRYLALAREQGLADRVVGRWSTSPGHCRMPPGEVVGALDDLVRWVDGGERPYSGEQR
jgi:pimeloyl-ACP methyl ester carboxylesterase